MAPAPHRRHLLRLTVLWPLCSVPWGHAQAAVTELDAASGVRVALERGALAAVAVLGKTDGFLANPKVRIPLPDVVQHAAQLLKATGQNKRIEELEIAMNRAAEAAVPQAQSLLVSAVKNMRLDDALQIIQGGNDAVTQFFANHTRTLLSEKFLPIVTSQTEKVSLAAKYNAVAGKAVGWGVLKAQDANVERYVTAKALDGLYFMIGEEERKIRKNPLATGSSILKKVFGGL